MRELQLGVATSDGLSAALVKANEAIGVAPNPFEAELVSHGLDHQEAYRVQRWYFAQMQLDRTQYATETHEQRNTQDRRLRAIYSSGVGRLFWENFGRQINLPFSHHVNQLIAKADQQLETQQ